MILLTLGLKQFIEDRDFDHACTVIELDKSIFPRRVIILGADTHHHAYNGRIPWRAPGD